MANAFEDMAREFRDRKERERQAAEQAIKAKARDEAEKLEAKRAPLRAIKKLIKPVLAEAQNNLFYLEQRDEIETPLPKLIVLFRMPPIDPKTPHAPELVFSIHPPRVVVARNFFPPPREASGRVEPIETDQIDEGWVRRTIEAFVAEQLSIL